MATVLNPYRPSDQLRAEVNQAWQGFPHEIKAELGSGGNGRVLSIQHNLKGLAVLKFYLPQSVSDDGSRSTAERRALMDQEARVMNRFGSFAAAVKVYELGPDTQGYIMEYLAGGTLAEHLQDRRSAGEKLAAFLPVLELLAAVQAEGIYHRDITLDNLMFDAAGQLKLIDFGYAHDLAKPIVHGMTAGKSGYAHPQLHQFPTKDRHDLQDVYSAVVCLVSWLSGSAPGRGPATLKPGPLAQALSPYLNPVDPWPSMGQGIGSFQLLTERLKSLDLGAEPASGAAKLKQRPARYGRWPVALLAFALLIGLALLLRSLLPVPGPQSAQTEDENGVLPSSSSADNQAQGPSEQPSSRPTRTDSATDSVTYSPRIGPTQNPPAGVAEVRGESQEIQPSLSGRGESGRQDVSEAPSSVTGPRKDQDGLAMTPPKVEPRKAPIEKPPSQLRCKRLDLMLYFQPGAGYERRDQLAAALGLEPASLWVKVAPFYVSAPITCHQWLEVMGSLPRGASVKLDDPVTGVSWYEAQEYARRLNRLEGGDGYRMIGEAEWEWVARQGNLGETGIWEWTADWYAPLSAKPGQGETARKVIRGGTAASNSNYRQPDFRGNTDPNAKSPSLGFRICKSQEPRFMPQ